MTTSTALDLARFARTALLAFLDLETAERPIDRKTAAAHFRGVCRAADALGVVSTPDALHLAVLDAVRAAGPRPGFRAVGNRDQKAYDQAVVDAIVAEIS